MSATSLSDADGDDVDELLQRADVAMYVAKEQHAGVVRYDPVQDDYDPANLALVTELRRAIEADELSCTTSPRLDFETGQFDAVEALVRWQHPEHGLLLARPVPAARRADRPHRPADRLGARPGRSPTSGTGTCRRELDVAVNVSARNFSRPDFADRVLRILQNVGISPNRLTIEITETALLADPVRAAIALRNSTRSACRSASTTSAPARPRCGTSRRCRSTSSRST